MLYAILIQIVLPMSVLAVLAWAWSRWKADVPTDVPKSDEGPLFVEKADVLIHLQNYLPNSDWGGLSPEEADRIKRMLDEELLPRGFTMQSDGTQQETFARPTYTRTFQYSKGDLILNVERKSDYDAVGDYFVCDAIMDGASQRVTGFSEYVPRRILTEDQLAAFQRDIGAFLDAGALLDAEGLD